MQILGNLNLDQTLDELVTETVGKRLEWVSMRIFFAKLQVCLKGKSRGIDFNALPLLYALQEFPFSFEVIKR